MWWGEETQGRGAVHASIQAPIVPLHRYHSSPLSLCSFTSPLCLTSPLSPLVLIPLYRSAENAFAALSSMPSFLHILHSLDLDHWILMVSTSLHFCCTFFIYVLYFFCIHSLWIGLCIALLAFFQRSPPGIMRTLEYSSIQFNKNSCTNVLGLDRYASPPSFSFSISLPSPLSLSPSYPLLQSTDLLGSI